VHSSMLATGARSLKCSKLIRLETGGFPHFTLRLYEYVLHIIVSIEISHCLLLSSVVYPCVAYSLLLACASLSWTIFCFFFSESRRSLPFTQSTPPFSRFAALVRVSLINCLTELLVYGQTGGNWLCIVYRCMCGLVASLVKRWEVRWVLEHRREAVLPQDEIVGGVRFTEPRHHFRIATSGIPHTCVALFFVLLVTVS